MIVAGNRLEVLGSLTSRLRAAASAWSQRSDFDQRQASTLRHEAIRLCHGHYFDRIPAYRRLCDEASISTDAPLTDILESCVVTDGLFKSYDAAWLAGGDFGAMRRWLADICAEPALGEVERLGSAGPDGATGIDTWLHALAQVGLELLYSSGTSGKLSFVPRGPATWDAYRSNGASYLMQRVVDLRIDLSRTDAVILGYRGGRMGIQRAGTELARYITRVDYLYDLAISGDQLWRLLNARAADDIAEAEAALMGERSTEEAYGRILERLQTAVSQGRPLWIFGAPHQVMHLCEMAGDIGLAPLPSGSVLNLGGGWKRFTGERLQRGELETLIEAALGIPSARVLEAYAMVELNSPLMRCARGRYHVPPLLEVVLFDEALCPLDIDGPTRGLLGFLDATATSYPGFIVTGDEVTVTTDTCPCGLQGPALVGEVRRASGREVRGCGGIMERVRA